MAFNFNTASVRATSQQVSFVNTTIDNMFNKHVDASHYGIMLAGDPGTGKTSSIKQLAELLGMTLVVAEAPHIIEEHLVKIPFIVYNPVTKKTTKKIDLTDGKINGDEYSIVHSNAFMAQELAKKTKISDEDYLEYIYKEENKNARLIYEAKGGTKDKIPEDIVEAREYFEKILFIDEYFRTEGPKIRNILRRIINGLLGDSRMPKNTYVIYASNFNDDGLEKISGHQVFEKHTMNARTKDEWFSWLVNKFEKDKRITLDENIVNKFHSALEDHHISYNDVESEIRTSPRRWEQILLYVNSSLPVRDEKEASTLLANIKSMFTNKDQKTSALYEKVEEAVKELIKETSNIEMNDVKEATNEDWYDTFKHQIKQKMKLGKHRTYVPVISGSPGIGKTQIVKSIAEELGLKLLYIDATSINKDDVIGIPVLKKTPTATESVDMQFSTPRMLSMIQQEIEEKVKEEIKRVGSSDDSGKEWKYLLFIDELDKVPNKTVFNAIRKVLLEKEFSDNYKLPDGTIVAGAINPSGVEGSHDFTGHIADVMDVINANPDWTKFRKHLENVEMNAGASKYRDKMINVLSIFVNKFKSAKKNGGEFNLNLGNSEKVYISPRDYTTMLRTSSTSYNRAIKLIELSDEEDLSVHNKDIREAIYKGFAPTLEMSFDKAELDYTDFGNQLKHWIETAPELKFLEEDITTKSAKVASNKGLFEALNKFVDSGMKHDLEDDRDFVAYMQSTKPAIFAKDLKEYVEEHLKEGGEKEFDLHKPIHDYIHPDTGDISITTVDGLRKYYKRLQRAIKKEESLPEKQQNKTMLDDIKNQERAARPYNKMDDKEIKELLDESSVKPYSVGKAHKRTFEIFSKEKTQEFLDKIKEAIDSSSESLYSNINIEKMQDILGEEIKALEKRYLGDHVEKLNIFQELL